MPEETSRLNDPAKIAEAGEKIYVERYKQQLEAKHMGEFVCIDVLTGDSYINRFPERALAAARDAAPSGVFHLIRIGSTGAFKVSYATRRDGWWNRIPRSAR